MIRLHSLLLSSLLLSSLLSCPVLLAQEPEPAPVPQEKPAPAVEQPAEEQGESEKPEPKEGEKPAPKERPEDEVEDQGKDQPKPTPKEKPEQGTEVDLPEDEPLPDGADPEDLRAMKSARDMVKAERRLRALIKAGKIKDVDKLLSFEEISDWAYEDGLKGIPKPVKELSGSEVIMTGFMLPIDEVEEIKEFLLVQSLWACCYGTPPDINGIVRVVMKGDARIDYMFDPVQIRGSFKVEATEEDGYVVDIYQLYADSVGLIK